MGNHATRVTAWLDGFSAALDRGDASGAAALFHDDSYWRDLVAFTWNITTLEGRSAITSMLEASLAAVAPTDWRVEGDPTEIDGVVEAWLTFETAVGHGRGHLRLRDDRCWTLMTTLHELAGFEEQQGPTRPLGGELGATSGRLTWQERRT